jgi:hypothetical protein
MIFDLYEIGGPDGFYVGQAKRLKGGGWERRVALHRMGGLGSSLAAHNLLARGASARCIGSVLALHGYINFIEARAWNMRVTTGWIAAHPRPQADANWGLGGQLRLPETRAKIAEKARGRRVSLETRAKMSVSRLGRPSYVRSPETLAKLSAAHLGQPAWNKGKPRPRETCSKIARALRGFKHSPETCAKRRAVRLGKKHSLDTRAKIAAALRGKPSGMLGKKHSQETRAKMSESRRHLLAQAGCE